MTIEVDAKKTLGEMAPVWRFFGYDEANYTYMKDGRKLLSELGKLGGPQVFIRCHHLLTSGDGSPALKWGSTGVYSEDAQGRPVFNWTIVDRIFDTYLERGLKPYVQIGFMPEALTMHPSDYPHNPPVDEKAPAGAGQSWPPKDYSKWGDLVFQWTKHCVEKYGRAEVDKWYWEVWNEPNIFYWHGTHEDYFKLYDYAVDGVRRALPSARVGGPETAGGPGGEFLREFLDHCAHGTNYVTGKTGSPLDFISFHAKGSPVFVNGHVRMGMGSQLKNIDDAFSVISSFLEYKHTPIVIGESDPEGCAACREPRDSYRNGTMYSSYTAASFPRGYELAAKYGVNFEGALTWAFEFEGQSWFAGFRALATNGVDLPVLNVFRMFAMMSGQRLMVQSSAGLDVHAIMAKNVREAPDVYALASLDKNKLCLLVWHYHDDDLPGPDAEIDLKLGKLPVANGTATLTHYRIDSTHGNSYESWKRMGSPPQPSAGQYSELEKEGQLARLCSPEVVRIQNGALTLKLDLARQAVSLLVFEFKE
ncbi:MAG: hypothetical protein WCD79_08740 [Chthoniobacteraceae bacterium]